nr:hypothetical protein [Tanacetum cinerariifolium]
MMVDQPTVAQLLQAPTEGYEDAIVVPAINADNFELKHGLLTLVQNKQFFGHDKEDPHAHIRYFNKIPSTLKFLNVSNTEAWDRFNDLLRACPHHALLLDKKSQNQAPATVKAAGESCVTCGGTHSYCNFLATDGNVYHDNIREFVSQASAVNYNQGNTSYRPPMMSNQIRPPGFPPVPNNQNVQLSQRKNQNRFNQNQNRGNNFNQGPIYQPSVLQPPAYQTHAYQAPAPQTQGVLKEDFSSYVKANDAFVNSNNASTFSSGTLSSNTIANPRSDLKAITTRSGVSYDGLQILPPTSFLPKVVENKPEATKDTVHPTNNGSTKDVQPPFVQSKSPILTSEPVNPPTIEPVISPVSAPRPNLRPSIPYPSRLQDQKLRDKAHDHREIFFQIFKDLNFNISFNSIERTLLDGSPKEVARKLKDPGKFLIPCDFPGKAACLALADLSASINLMPLSVWNKLSLPDLTPMCMTLDLADHSISHPVGVAEDVYVKVGSFHFSADFVVVDFNADPRVPIILRRSFLKTGRALIDVFEGELTLRVGKEAITFNLDQTSRYSANYNDMTAKRIDVINMACEEYSQEHLGFSDVIASGNPTPYYDLIVSTTSLTLTSFGNSDFLFEEVDAFLAIDDDPTLPKVDQSYLDPEGDILLLEAFLNDDPSLPPPNQGNYLPEVRKELKICEAKSDKSSIDEPPEVELKYLPPHLEYAFPEGDDKLPIIIAKDLSVEEKTALITVLKSHKRAIAWKLSDIKGIDPKFCTHKILMEEDFEPVVQHQRRARKPLKFSRLATIDPSEDTMAKITQPRSKTMTEAESNYTTMKKEMLAVVYAFEKFWSYLIMNKSIEYTNHSALKYLFAKKVSKARLLRWVLLIQEFTFKVIDTKGAENLAADHLSKWGIFFEKTGHWPGYF